ncbi:MULTISPECIES: DUF411 domain-containing protein [unclassified Caulobacter]|uniref:DUF411 domain-containing protein n=1 Tax=unclassified Caulobacter TaxID=2648921 RepID=UPI001FF057CD|nr:MULTISPECIES: DUF411 domain-containing protein [unclassified Caulobacter]MCA0359001.1 DUF411 domain-containing protein [Pseudomonadota bacterium]MDR7232610.1 hypothetical protein [Caulobacter sp. BE264]
MTRLIRRPLLARRALLLGAGAATLLAACAQGAEPLAIQVYKTPFCGCCTKWVEALRAAGLKPSINELDDLTPVRATYGVDDTLSSCHTARIGGYTIEGHVPPSDILRLLQERPKALGLAVPGMPIGSPGMEMPGAVAEPYATLLLLDAKGATRVFARHG